MTDLLSIAEEVKQLIRDEWDKQGHDMTGAFKKQLTHEIVESSDKVNILIIDGTEQGYGRIINVGVKPEDIKYPYAKKRIKGLTNFVKIRMGLDDEEAEKVAYAIATKHAVEGMPMPNSKYSKSVGGARIQFVEDIQPQTREIVRRYMFELIKLKAAQRDN